MKNIFLKIFMTVLFLSTVTLFANSIEIGRNANDFLNNYYSKGFNLGKSTETRLNNDNILISEVLNLENKSIKGYVAVDKKTNELLYFVDYLKDTKQIKTIDFKKNKTDILNLQKEKRFENFVKIDLIKEIEKINLDPSSAYKFWGESCGPSWYTPDGACIRTCSYYVLWVNTGSYQESC